MESYNPSKLVKQIENQVQRILRQLDWEQVSDKGRKAVTELHQALADAKIYTQDYELSEMRDEQIDSAKQAKKHLKQAHSHILRASEFDVFGPIDVAHLTAQIDQLEGDLK